MDQKTIEITVERYEELIKKETLLDELMKDKQLVTYLETKREVR